MIKLKEIKLTQNKVAIVDNEDFEELNQHKWYAWRHRQTWYARRTVGINGKSKTIRMHREILNAPKGVQVDHVNGNSLDNSKKNLRLATNQQNGFNQKRSHRDNKLGIKGVCWSKSKKKFCTQIGFAGKTIYLGYFNLLDDADIAYRRAEVKHFMEFARESSKRYVKILSKEYQMSLAG